MKKTFLLLGVFVLFFTCQKDPEPVENDIPVEEDCYGEPEPKIGHQECWNLATPCSQYIGTFQLEDTSKTYLPFYCSKIGTTKYFMSEDNRFKNLKLRSKAYQETNGSYYTSVPCLVDTSDNIDRCLNYEYMYYSFEDSSFSISTYLRTMPDVRATEPGGVGDVLTLSISGGVGPGLSIIVNQRTLSYETIGNIQFLPEVELMGEIYENVFTNDVSGTPVGNSKYYFSFELGVVGFTDGDGVAWRMLL